MSGCVAPYPEEEYDLYGAYETKVAETSHEKSRNIDDMLGMKPRPVHEIQEQKNNESDMKSSEQKKPAVKTAVLSTKEAVKNSPDVKGRFGSKEKRFLRKGLNAPAGSMQYDQTVAHDEIVVVRGLTVRPLNKTEEQKILNDIVASQNLVSAEEKNAPEEEKSPQVNPVEKETPKNRETVLPEKQSVPYSVVKTAEKQPETVLAPVSLTAPVSQEDTFAFETQMPLIDAPAKEKRAPLDERIVLKAPSETIVLIPPEGVKENNADISRIEIYLED